MSVTSATIRLATPEEAAQAKGGMLWKSLTAPWNLINKVMGAWELYKNRADTLAWQEPLPLAGAHKVAKFLGWYPELNFIRVIPTPLGNFHMIDGEGAVFRAFFDNHRNDAVFESNLSFKMMLGIIQKTFPEVKITEEDGMMTCSPEKTKEYRKMITKLLRGEKMREVVQDEVQRALISWEGKCRDGGSINASQETRLFASHVITRLLLGQDAGNEELAEAVNFINVFITLMTTKRATAEDEAGFQKALGVFKDNIEAVLTSGMDIPLFEGKEVGEGAKRLMIFSIFFAGQETVASLLTYILWNLGNNEEKQAGLTANKMHNFFVNSIHDFTPAYGVNRVLKNDVCLDYHLEGESSNRKAIFFKGDFLGARIKALADNTPLPENSEGELSYSSWFPFGGGPHLCPGKALAEKEIKELITALISEYRIELESPSEIHTAGRVSLQIEEDVFIKVLPKEEIS